MIKETFKNLKNKLMQIKNRNYFKNMILSSERMFCYQPWIQLEFTKNRLLPCCHAQGTEYSRSISLNEAFNSSYMKAIRQDFVSGKLPKVCSNCAWSLGRVKIADGGEVPRLSSEFFKPSFPDWKFLDYKQGPSQEFIENLKILEEGWNNKDIEIKAIPVYLILQIDTSCNYKCLACNQGKNDETIPIEILGDVLKNHKKIGMVYITGGEPFNSRLGLEFMKQCAKIKPHFYIIMSTNGSIIDFDILEKLNIQRLNVSTWGATKETYEYWHKGGNYDKILENLERLSKLRKETGNPSIITSAFVVFNQNIKESCRVIERDEKLGIETMFSLGEARGNKEWDLLCHDKIKKEEKIKMLEEAYKLAKYSRTKNTIKPLIELIRFAHNYN